MTLRDTLRQRSVPFLEPGEQIEAIFTASWGLPPYLTVLFPGFALFCRPFVIVVATDRAILVLNSGWIIGTKPRSLRARLPREPMRELPGLWFPLRLGGRLYWVKPRFRKDLRAANAAMAEVLPHSSV